MSLVDLAVFVATFAVFVAPGWPLARWYAGDELAPWARAILAVFLGYLIGALLYMALRALGITAPAGVLAACAGVAVLLVWVLRRRPQPGLVEFARVDVADAAVVVGFLVLVAVLVGLVFAMVGRQTEGGLAYRAYFTADLFAHMSVTSELAKGATPPVNPYQPGEALPYYWGYFTFPALFAVLRPHLLPDRGILLTDFLIAAVCVSLWYLVARTLGASRRAAALAWIVVLLASSFEGTFLLARQLVNGESLGGFRSWNVDAVTRWAWELPPVDGLHRIMWYTPQHEMAVTMGLVTLAVVLTSRNRNSVAQGVIEGILLGSAVAFSSFNALLLTAWYGALEVVLLARAKGTRWKSWLRARATAAAIVVAIAGLTFVLEMVPRDASEILFGWNRNFMKGPWTFIGLSFGPALVLAPLGAWALMRRQPLQAVALALLALTCIAVFLFIEVRGHENTYIPFRTGQLFYVVLALLLAAAIDDWGRWVPARASLARAVLLAGVLLALPTVALDWYNTRDITNVAMTPGGFPWTVYISQDDLRAARWIDRSLPPDAVVQPDASARGRASWALIPAFAYRRQRTGVALFEPNPERFEKDIARVRIVFRSPNLDDAYGYCQRMGIQYLYVGAAERAAHGSISVDKFQNDTARFRTVYQEGSVTIYRVVT